MKQYFFFVFALTIVLILTVSCGNEVTEPEPAVSSLNSANEERLSSAPISRIEEDTKEDIATDSQPQEETRIQESNEGENGQYSQENATNEQGILTGNEELSEQSINVEEYYSPLPGPSDDLATFSENKAVCIYITKSDGSVSKNIITDVNTVNIFVEGTSNIQNPTEWYDYPEPSMVFAIKQDDNISEFRVLNVKDSSGNYLIEDNFSHLEYIISETFQKTLNNFK